MATEKVSACNVASDCLLQCRCEKKADVLFEIEPHDTVQFRVPILQNRNWHNPWNSLNKLFLHSVQSSFISEST